THFSSFSLMGAVLDRFWKKEESLRILMLGLDHAGSSTILYQFKLRKAIETVATNGYNVEQFRFKNVPFTIWDVGGPNKTRTLWHYYYPGMQGLIFVIDSSDIDRIDEAKEALETIINYPDMINTKLLVFANKKDLPNALSTDELTDRLQLKLRTPNENFKWHVQASNAKTAEGVYEGLAWMEENLR
ncbi:hypothetical protein PFISCL1PPCAC_14720, partial [Pristionchus fissidentatus]